MAEEKEAYRRSFFSCNFFFRMMLLPDCVLAVPRAVTVKKKGVRKRVLVKLVLLNCVIVPVGRRLHSAVQSGECCH